MHGCYFIADIEVSFYIFLSVGDVRHGHSDLSEFSYAQISPTRVIGLHFAEPCRDGEGSMIPKD